MAVEAPILWENVNVINDVESPNPPPLNILVIGSGPFASQTLQELYADNHNIKGVVAPKIRDGKRIDSLRTTAEELEISDVSNLGLIQNERFAEKIKNMGIDLIVGANLTATVKPHIQNSTPLGVVAFHPSMLPDFKGRSAINWQIINAENNKEGVDYFGLSCYRIEDDGDPSKIDSGRLIGQIMLEVPNIHTAASIYKDILADFGVRLMRDSVRKIAQKYAKGEIYLGEEQKGEGSYQPPLAREMTRIDWTQPAYKVRNLIRGSQNNPKAWTTIDGESEEISLMDAQVVKWKTKNPGRTKLIDDTGILIEAGDGLILAQSMSLGESVAIKPSEFANDRNIVPPVFR